MWRRDFPGYGADLVGIQPSERARSAATQGRSLEECTPAYNNGRVTALTVRWGTMTDLIESRAPNPIDLHVGARIRLRRRMQGVSQEKLADALGLTFQQVQKYERGTNRVSASKLYEIATALRSPISYFFDGLVDPAGDHQAGDGRPSD